MGLGIGAALIGGAAGLLGGRQSNKANAKLAESQQEFQADQVREQMAFQDAANRQQMWFQEQMANKAMNFSEIQANTAHRREVADLRAAGLNPILSGTGGMGAHSAQGVAAQGASSSGAAAQGARAEMRNVVGEGVGSALQAGQLASVIADLDVKKATAENIEAQTKTELNRPVNVAADTYLKERSADERKGQEALHSANYNKSLAETDAVQGYRRHLAEAEAEVAKAQARLTGSSAVSAGVKADLDKAYSEYERIIGMGEGATSAVRNLIPFGKLRR